MQNLEDRQNSTVAMAKFLLPLRTFLAPVLLRAEVAAKRREANCAESPGVLLPPSPPAEKPTARQDQARQALPSIRLLLAQYRFNSLHDWHFEIFFIVAIIFHLTHVVLQGL